jgi:flagellar motor switch protein FliN/FliY
MSDELEFENEFSDLGGDEGDFSSELLSDVDVPSSYDEGQSGLETTLNFGGTEDDHKNKIDLLLDLPIKVAIELGRTKMFIKDVLDLDRGSIVEFGKLAGEPVDLLINDRKMAEGEVVVIDKHFGIRITSVVDNNQLKYRLQ